MPWFGEDVAGGTTRIPSTPEELRETLRDRPVEYLRMGIRAALPNEVVLSGLAPWVRHEAWLGGVPPRW